MTGRTWSQGLNVGSLTPKHDPLIPFSYWLSSPLSDTNIYQWDNYSKYTIKKWLWEYPPKQSEWVNMPVKQSYTATHENCWDAHQCGHASQTWHWGKEVRHREHTSQLFVTFRAFQPWRYRHFEPANSDVGCCPVHCRMLVGFLVSS